MLVFRSRGGDRRGRGRKWGRGSGIGLREGVPERRKNKKR